MRIVRIIAVCVLLLSAVGGFAQDAFTFFECSRLDISATHHYQ